MRREYKRMTRVYFNGNVFFLNGKSTRNGESIGGIHRDYLSYVFEEFLKHRQARSKAEDSEEEPGID